MRAVPPKTTKTEAERLMFDGGLALTKKYRKQESHPLPTGVIMSLQGTHHNLLCTLIAG